MFKPWVEFIRLVCVSKVDWYKHIPHKRGDVCYRIDLQMD